jgi:uncharacterized protein YkwD
MRRFVALVLTGMLGSGCAMVQVPSFPSFSFSGSDSSSPKEVQAGFASAPKATEEASSSSPISSLWDNFSAPFRASPKPVPVAMTGKASFDVKQAQNLINQYRAKKGLRPLSLEPRLTKAANMLAQDMSEHDRMSHYGPNGAGIEQRLAAVGYDYSVAAENIGVGQLTVEEMVRGWEKSPDHARNMQLSDARNMGIAMVQRPDSRFKTFWALVLGAPGR